VTETERMPSLVGGNTELGCSKRKICNVFSKPNSDPLPSHRQVRQVRRVSRWFLGVRVYRKFKNSSGRVYEELLLERGLYPGGETPVTPDEPDVLEGGDLVDGVWGRVVGVGFVECGGLCVTLW
jgi:hypothetical protein